MGLSQRSADIVHMSILSEATAVVAIYSAAKDTGTPFGLDEAGDRTPEIRVVRPKISDIFF